MKIEIVTFQVGAKTYKFKEPLMLESEPAKIREDPNGDLAADGIYLSDNELCLSACVTSWGECEEIIREELAMLWEEYALAPDDELTEGAIALKKKLLEMVEEEK